MRGQTHTSTPGRRLLAGASLPLGLAASVGLAAALGARLRALLPLDLGTAQVDAVVEVGIVGVGIALALWLAWGLALATLCAVARAVGSSWQAGERAVARHAPTAVRRVLVIALGAGLGMSGAVASHAAAPDDLDVGWTATARTATAPAATGTTPTPGAALASPTAPSAPTTGSTHAPEVPPSPAVAPAPNPTGATTPGTAAMPAEMAPSADPAAVPTSPASRPDDAPSDHPHDAPASTALGAGTSPDGTDPSPAASSPAAPTPAARSSHAQPSHAPDVVSRAVPATTPSAAAGADGAPAAGPLTEGAPSVDSARAVVVVEGDSLWRIAQRELGPQATSQEVAAAWPRWYAANADVIGSDPDLLRPGQVLRAPAADASEAAAPAPEATR